MPGAFGAVSNGSVSFYGDFIDSIEFQFGGLGPADVVGPGPLSALSRLTDLGGGLFRLASDNPDTGDIEHGIQVCGFAAAAVCIRDVIFAAGDLPGQPDREFTLLVTAVNDRRVPEPALLGLVVLGLSGVAARRRRASGTTARRLL